MEHDGDRLTERIGYAEDWLARARRHLEAGDRARGTLTLMLAEAEMQRARELGRDAPASVPPARWLAAAVTVSVAAAIAVMITATREGHPESASPSVLPVVTLADGTGSLLSLLQPPPVAATTLEEATMPPARRPAAARGAVATVPSSAGAPALVTTVRSTATPPQPPTPAVAPAATAPPAAPVPVEVAAPAQVAPPAPAPPAIVLSEADLIDLVLAAERSLRRSGQ